jgi:hypothetical protein
MQTIILCQLAYIPAEQVSKGANMMRILTLLAVLLTVVFLAVLTFASVLGVVDPYKASAGYGVAVSDSSGALFYRVFASRNLVIIVAALIFLILRQWKSLAILVSLTAALALFDMAILIRAGVTPPGFHPVALGLILATSALLWIKVWGTRSAGS